MAPSPYPFGLRNAVATYASAYASAHAEPSERHQRFALDFDTTTSSHTHADSSPSTSSNDASPPRQVKPYSGTCTREPTVTTQHLGRSLETPSAKGSTGQQRLLTPLSSYAPVRDASTTHGRRTSRSKPSKPSLSHGRSPCGGWTWLGLCRKPKSSSLVLVN